MKNYKFERTPIKNYTYYYFDDIIRLKDMILIKTQRESPENILISDISYKALIVSKHLHIKFYKINVFIRIYDGSRYSQLFRSEKYNAIYDRIRYLISKNQYHIYFVSLICKNQI